MGTLTTKYVVPFSVAALIAVPAASAHVAPMAWQNRAEIRLSDGRASASNSAATVAMATQTWTELSTELRTAVVEASDANQPVSLTAQQLAFQVAASLEIVGGLNPTITDNEEGGIVFYWKGVAREIQIELDRDGSHFVRARGADGQIAYEHEGRGAVDTGHVNRAILEWSMSRTLQLSGGLQAA